MMSIVYRLQYASVAIGGDILVESQISQLVRVFDGFVVKHIVDDRDSFIAGGNDPDPVAIDSRSVPAHHRTSAGGSGKLAIFRFEPHAGKDD
jgi:hypothetical protein